MNTALAHELEIAEEVQGLSSSDREYLRKVAKADLFVLAKGILRYPDVTKAAHGALCRFCDSHESYRRLMLMPRGHLKSTLITISDSIRLVLARPEYERVLIASETVTQANAFLREIRSHWEKNTVLRSLFPELVPPRFSGQGVDWSTRSATLIRKATYKESHWATVGVGGAITGFHFTRIKADDLIGLEAARSPAEMENAKAWNGNIEPLLEDHNTNVIDWVGTRWSRNDLYAQIMDQYPDELAVFVREAIENGVIIFPEKYNWKRYEQLQTKSPTVWFAQYCNNPVAAGQQDFPSQLLRNYRFSADAREVIFQRDGEEKRWKIENLDRVITVDPNSGSVLAEDMAAIIASGISPDDEVFVLDAWSDRVSPSGLVAEVFKKADRWRPRVVGIEKAGQQTTEHYFREEMQRREQFFNVQPVHPKNRNKEDRIRYYMEPIIRSGLLYLLPSQQVLREQIANFPDNILIDELDALAYGPEVWRRPYAVEDMDSNQRALRTIVRRRARRTGY